MVKPAVNVRAENLRAALASTHAHLDRLVKALVKTRMPAAEWHDLVVLRRALDLALEADDKQKESETKT